jgi:hypothetical protein
MTPPRFLLGVVVVVWGWYTGLAWFAVPLAILLEAAPFIHVRWAFSDANIQRIWTLCGVLFLSLAAFLALTATFATGSLAVQQFFMWMPVCYTPLVLAQSWSTAGRIDVRLLSLLARRTGERKKPAPTCTVNVAYPFALLALLGTCASNPRSPWFYILLAVMVGWALWPSSRHRIRWAGFFVIAAFLGYAGQLGLHEAHSVLEGQVLQWFTADGGQRIDAHRTRTAIGSLVQRKSSDRIELRVESGPGVEGMLLREASYDVYVSVPSNGTDAENGGWYATGSDFTPEVPDADGMTWTINATSSGAQRVTVALPFQGNILLPVPNGTTQLVHLAVSSLTKNRFGSMRAGNGPNLLTYTAIYNRDGESVSAPSEKDLAVPLSESNVIQGTVKELGLTEQSPQQVMGTLEHFFRDRFQYALTPSGISRAGTTALEDFLGLSRAGHCEYFATATVLLLRAAGVPARYAVGYSVQEYSPWEGWYIVRGRHAHAWAQAYVDGAWRDFDTTPANWSVLEQSNRPGWSQMTDAWDWLAFRLASWQWPEHLTVSVVSTIGGIFLGGVAALAWRRYGRKRVVDHNGSGQNGADVPGRDSEFYAIERILLRKVPRRHPGESLLTWLTHVQTSGLTPGAESLRAIAMMHYRLRFQSKTLSGLEREALARECKMWIASYRGMEANERDDVTPKGLHT